jgi:hypothetical protein
MVFLPIYPLKHPENLFGKICYHMKKLAFLAAVVINQLFKNHFSRPVLCPETCICSEMAESETRLLYFAAWAEFFANLLSTA